ncbi:MAG: protein kinase [Ktedonobacteraceae bacterium]|nr:protein kinase [Ktedonobacteraceae bacterium]
MADLSGQQFGDYRLLRCLGSGTFGEVYEGEQIYLKTHAAIKILRAQLDQAEREQFLKEARIIASLEHPHIARVLSFSIQQHTSYLVMQLAQRSLKDRFGSGHPQPIEAILPSFQQAAEGLQYAHDRRVMHLDIKPANLLLTAQEQVLLADFGLAMELRTQRTHQTLQGFAGTSAYAAPEQFQNKPCLASDQYALGVLLYQWLTGTFPFEGDWLAIGHQKVNQDCPLLRAKVKSISQDLESVVLRALARDPKSRFASASDFATALSQAVEGNLDATTHRTQSPPSVTTSSSASTASSTQGSQATGQAPPSGSMQTQEIAPLDGEVVLRSVRAGHVPPTWRTFFSSPEYNPPEYRKQARDLKIGSAVGVSFFSCGGVFFVLLTLFSFSQYQGWPVFAILAAASIFMASWGGVAFWRDLEALWKEKEKCMLVLRPEGYVYGTTDPPHVVSMLDFKSASSVQAKNGSVHVTLIEKDGVSFKETPNIRPDFAFTLPPTVAQTIAQAYLDFEKRRFAQ